MQIVAMLQEMENDSPLRRGLVTAIAKRFGVVCLHSSLLMEEGGVHMHATGIINSPEFNSQKKFWEATYIYI